MNHFKKTALLVSLSLVLTACGGGGGDSSGSPSNTGTTGTTDNGSTNGSNLGSGITNPTDQSNGSVLEKLDTSKEYKVLYDFFAISGVSRVIDIKQNDQGIVTEFGSLKLYGNMVGKEIDGNKNFALARVTNSTFDYTDYKGVTETTDTSKYTNGSIFYFAHRPLTNKVISATTKQVNCTDLKTTQARVNGANAVSYITPTVHNGSISLNPDGSIGVAFTIKTAVDETSYASKMNWIEGSNAYNGYNTLGIANQTGSSNQIGAFAVGENGANSFVVGSIYKIALNSGASYQGLMSMTCNF